MSRNRGIATFLYVVPCTLVACAVWIHTEGIYHGQKYVLHRGRILLQEVSCIPSGMEAFPPDFLSQEQRQSGGVAIHFLILMYVCGMTAVVCDKYFVPALEAIAQSLHLSPDVAGATFMAMGASAPELFSSILGSFVTEGDIGLGTILGSAVFNILGISGIIGLVLWNEILPIQWYPVVRDCIVYGITVSALSLIIADNIVKWWESLVLLTIFTTYIILMHFNPRVERAAKGSVKYLNGCCHKNPDPERGPLLDKQILETAEGASLQATEKSNSRQEDKTKDTELSDDVEECFCLSAWRILIWAPSLLFRLTIPTLRFFPVTFVMSIIWMGALSYLAVWMVTIIGYTFHIPDAVSGLTFLAAGSSVPDLVATVIIAKSGKGNMAISNLLGSNTFDLAFCLGAPWFVKSLTSRKGQLLVYSSAMVYTSTTLLLTLMALLLTFQLAGWCLNRTVGFVCLCLYAICITLACLYEMNVFGSINKPTCF